MPIRDQRDAQRLSAAIRQNLRRVRIEVLPRARRHIERSVESLRASASRELESTRRLLDPVD